MRRLKILEWGHAFIITEGGKAWPLKEHKRTYRLTAEWLWPTKGARDE